MPYICLAWNGLIMKISCLEPTQKIEKKIDFGLLWRDYKYTNSGNNWVDGKDIEIVGKHID